MVLGRPKFTGDRKQYEKGFNTQSMAAMEDDRLGAKNREIKGDASVAGSKNGWMDG